MEPVVSTAMKISVALTAPGRHLASQTGRHDRGCEQEAKKAASDDGTDRRVREPCLGGFGFPVLRLIGSTPLWTSDIAEIADVRDDFENSQTDRTSAMRRETTRREG